VGWLVKLLGGNIFGGIDKILSRFVANKDSVETNIHDEQMAAQNAMAAEFQMRGRRFWLDSVIDFFNRLPRPLFALHVIALMYWAVLDPITFGAAMTSLSLMPLWLAGVVAQVILLFMGGRMLHNMTFDRVSPKKIKEVLEVQREILALKADDKPMSLDAIKEWNRKRQEG